MSNALEDTRLTKMAFVTRGDVYFSVGKHQQAKEQYEKVLTICLTTSGKSHPSTAIIYKQLGSVYHQTGQYNQAKDCFEKALDIHTSINGQENSTSSKPLLRPGWCSLHYWKI